MPRPMPATPSVSSPWGPRAAYKAWLDPEIEDATALQQLLCPNPAAEMTAYPVNPIVNKAGNEGPECIEAVTSEA